MLPKARGGAEEQRARGVGWQEPLCANNTPKQMSAHQVRRHKPHYCWGGLIPEASTPASLSRAVLWRGN